MKTKLTQKKYRSSKKRASSWKRKNAPDEPARSERRNAALTDSQFKDVFPLPY